MARPHALGAFLVLAIAISGERSVAGPVLLARPDSVASPDIAPARYLRLVEAVSRDHRGRDAFNSPGIAFDGVEANPRDYVLVLGEEDGPLLIDFVTSSHYLDFLMFKRMLLIESYLYGRYGEKKVPSSLRTPAAVGPLALVYHVSAASGETPTDERSTAGHTSRIADLGQFRVLWFLALLVPMALALAGLGSKEHWFSAALNCWVLAILGLGTLILLYAQGAGAIWYAMAELMVPFLLSAGLGCCLAGVLAR